MNIDLLLATFAGYLAVFGLSDRPQDPKVRDAREEPRRGARRQNDEDEYLERPGAKRR